MGVKASKSDRLGQPITIPNLVEVGKTIISNINGGFWSFLTPKTT